jgi:ABC-type transport system involved in multi-copper enzyme maturation permease subunit
MLRHTFTIARFTLLEGLRARFFRVAGLVLLLVLAGALFAGELAITESERIRATLLAAFLRPATIFLLSLYIISSMAREFNDKGTELILALDLPRASYVLGKLIGFALLGTALAFFAGLLGAVFAPVAPVMLWSVSLLLEIWLVAALSLFCAISFTQVVPAASLALGFYLLARNITTIQLLGSSPVLDAHSFSHQVITGLLDIIALVLPHLDNFTQSAWLANYPATWNILPSLLLQSAITLALLTGAAMFDFYRKNF